MSIVSLYAAVLAVIFVVLSVRTLRLRRRLQIAIGDGSNPAMIRAVRAHSNFAEYVPLALLLIYFSELAQAPPWALHALCSCLLVGRVSHAFGISQANENFAFRVAGMALTFTTILGAAAYLIVQHAIALVR